MYKSVMYWLVLSREVCEKLHMLSSNFPKEEARSVSCVGAEVSTGSSVVGKTCGCPARVPAPDPPAMVGLGVQMVDENRAELENIIREHYSDSVFNVCKHNVIPVMTGEPLRIVVDPSIKPHAVNKPVPIPIHWKDQVREQLESDCAMGVIEPVPVGTPVTWCARMCVVPKHDGTPRRTVDLQALTGRL